MPETEDGLPLTVRSDWGQSRHCGTAVPAVLGFCDRAIEDNRSTVEQLSQPFWDSVAAAVVSPAAGESGRGVVKLL